MSARLLQFCCWDNPQFSHAVLYELLWQVWTHTSPTSPVSPPTPGLSPPHTWTLPTPPLPLPPDRLRLHVRAAALPGPAAAHAVHGGLISEPQDTEGTQGHPSRPQVGCSKCNIYTTNTLCNIYTTTCPVLGTVCSRRFSGTRTTTRSAPTSASRCWWPSSRR